ncbi:hypothetical protein [Streptomonospora litoralis]|uniref:DUF2567 domain-containing protein n=1 Tax=Streptomonospora litoralis TaxID=2498135 RepID=A0A4V0ZJL7_9ACTN|nr:hypothetical protein [Streptomonospora litoralis]QBI53922.1 hypothetical protein EKD16_10680 [Streptomonospora litoralis]
MMRRRLAAGGAVLGANAALGLPLGLLWWLLAPRPRVTVGRDGGILPFPVSETNFAVDGYFALIMMITGLLCGYAVYMLQYRLAARDATDLRLVCLLGMAAGAAAGSVLAWQVGTLLDAAEFQRAVEAAGPGEVIRSGLRLEALSALVAWPFVAVLQYGLFDAVSLWRGDLPAQRRAAGHEAGSEAVPAGSDTADAPTGGAQPSGAPEAAEAPAAERPEDTGPHGPG